MENNLKQFERLLIIMDDLREKCPWDKKQTLESLRHLTIEETYELVDAISNGQPGDVGEELGDVLFVLANIGRRWGINPEDALRRSNAKFSRRFQAIEAAMKAQGLSMKEATLVDMEAAYQAAKSQEKNKLS